jgi:hypothetical protein
MAVADFGRRGRCNGPVHQTWCCYPYPTGPPPPRPKSNIHNKSEVTRKAPEAEDSGDQCKHGRRRWVCMVRTTSGSSHSVNVRITAGVDVVLFEGQVAHVVGHSVDRLRGVAFGALNRRGIERGLVVGDVRLGTFTLRRPTRREPYLGGTPTSKARC